MEFALTYHVEDPRERPSAEVYAEVAEQIELADELGFHLAWFSEHHAYIHLGHLPTPLTFATYLLGRTRRIHLGTAVVCLNLHHPVDVAEQIAVADVASGGRMSPGFGSGSTPPEYAIFGQDAGDAASRHRRFAAALDVVTAVWRGQVPEVDFPTAIPAHEPLPLPPADLPSRVWIAANSEDAARIAGERNFNLMLSRERSIEDYRRLREAYLSTGARGGVSVSRSVFVGESNEHAYRVAEPALRLLWERMKREGKAPADEPTPETLPALAERVHFIVGDAETCAAAIAAMREQVSFPNFNLQPRWEGLPHAEILASLRRFAAGAMPRLRDL